MLRGMSGPGWMRDDAMPRLVAGVAVSLLLCLVIYLVRGCR